MIWVTMEPPTLSAIHPPTGRISAHWIYVLTGGLLVTLGAEFISFGVLARVVGILRARKAFRRP